MIRRMEKIDTNYKQNLETLGLTFQNGKTLTQLFYDGKLAETWTNSTPFSGQFPFFFQPEFFQNP